MTAAMALLELVHIPPEEGNNVVVSPAQAVVSPSKVITGFDKTEMVFEVDSTQEPSIKV